MSDVEAENSIFARTYIRYSIAVVAVAAAFLLRETMVHYLGTNLPLFITLSPAVMFVALLCGLWPGLLATVLATLVVDYWIVPPRGSFAIASTSDAIALALFFGTGVFMSLVADAYRRNQKQVATFKKEQALRESEAKLLQASEFRGLALEAAELGTWDYRFKSGDVIWDERCRNLFGVARGDHFEYESAIARIHPEDRPAVDEAVKQAIAGADDGAYHREFRVVWPDGSIHWVASHGRVHFEGAGEERRAVRFVGVNLDHTDRKQAELRAAHLASFPELNTNPIFETDLDGKITYVNPAARQQFPSLSGTGTEHPGLKDWGAVVASLKARAIHSTTREVESDGLVFLQTIHYAPEFGTVRAYFADITERKRAEESLRSSEQRWATTLQSIGDAVISTDGAGNVDFMNDVAQKLTGWTLTEAKGSDLSAVFDIVQEVTRIKPESPVAKVIRLGKVVGLANHTVLIHRDGTEIPIEDSAAPIRDSKGQMEGVVLVFHDCLEQRKVEAALRNSDRLATTGRLAATIAHEIHNPLDAVGNLLYMINQEAQDDTARQYASLASSELARVTQMTRQMLVFQREAVNPVPVRIEEIVESVTALYERKITSAGIRLEQQIDFDGHILVLPGELRQIIANLVGNAIEAVGSRRGTITLRAYESQDRRRGLPGLRVLVADDGPGIPEHVRTKIFEPFFTTKGESGTGLGLWIASDILRKYDGTLRMRSCTQPDRSGTCFSLFLPFEISSDLPIRS